MEINMSNLEIKPEAPWVTGAAFAVVVAVIYIACAAAGLLFPDAFLAFANNWVHGIDLTLIRRPATNALSVGDWGAGFATAIVAGFLAGAIYGWARDLFVRLSAAHPA
jgi:hypothetical protein